MCLFKLWVSLNIRPGVGLLGHMDKDMASQVAQWVTNLFTMQETQETRVYPSVGWEDPMEKEMATHSSILAWENPMDRGA